MGGGASTVSNSHADFSTQTAKRRAFRTFFPRLQNRRMVSNAASESPALATSAAVSNEFEHDSLPERIGFGGKTEDSNEHHIESSPHSRGPSELSPAIALLEPGVNNSQDQVLEPSDTGSGASPISSFPWDSANDVHEQELSPQERMTQFCADILAAGDDREDFPDLLDDAYEANAESSAVAEMFTHTAMSLGMDNEDLLFNLMYFNNRSTLGNDEDLDCDQGGGDAEVANVGTRRGPSAANAVNSFGAMMDSVTQETLALHSENNTPYKLNPASTEAVAGLEKLKYSAASIEQRIAENIATKTGSNGDDQLFGGHSYSPGSKEDSGILTWEACDVPCTAAVSPSSSIKGDIISKTQQEAKDHADLPNVAEEKGQTWREPSIKELKKDEKEKNNQSQQMPKNDEKSAKKPNKQNKYAPQNKGHNKEKQQIMTECAVCRDEFEENCEIILIPACKHFFHEECINRWMKLQNWCPICRTPISK